jgi:E3 ubiquitin-protein ligase MARCH6
MHVYPSVFILAGTVHSAILLCKILSTWSSAIRDKEFLVEMRLRNLEPELVQRNDENVEGGDATLREAEELPGVEPVRDMRNEEEAVVGE